MTAPLIEKNGNKVRLHVILTISPSILLEIGSQKLLFITDNCPAIIPVQLKITPTDKMTTFKRLNSYLIPYKIW